MAVWPNPRASCFPLRMSVKSMPAKSRSKSFGLRIQRSTYNCCSNAVPSKGVTFVTSTSGGAPDRGDKEKAREGTGNCPHGSRSYRNIQIGALPVEV